MLEQLGSLLAVGVEIIVLHVFTEGTFPTVLDRPGRDLDIWSKEIPDRVIPTRCASMAMSMASGGQGNSGSIQCRNACGDLRTPPP